MYSFYNIINSNILTLDDSCPIANSITIGNGKIIAINSPKSTFKSIDCNGATILPGITDSHFHLKNLGKRLEQLDLKGIKSIEKIVKTNTNLKTPSLDEIREAIKNMKNKK